MGKRIKRHKKSQNEATGKLEHYLSHLNAFSLLSGIEEKALLSKLNGVVKDLFSKCAASHLFRKNLATMLQAKIKPSPMRRVKQQRILLEEDLNETDYYDQVNYIVKRLNAKTGWKKAFASLNMSGNLSYAILEVIKNKKNYLDKKNEMHKIKKLFGAQSLDHLYDTVLVCMRDLDLREQLSDRIGIWDDKTLILLLKEVNSTKQFLEKRTHLDVLTKEKSELEELYKIIEAAQTEAVSFTDELAERNLRLAFSRSRYYTGRGLDFEDIIQEANIGLIKTILKFDVDRGTKFSTLATWWIDQSIRRSIANLSKIVRIPTHVQALQGNVKDATIHLIEKNGINPTDEQIEQFTGIGLETLKMMRNIARYPIDLEIQNDEGETMDSSLCLQPDEKNPFHVTSQNLLREKVREVIDTLDATSQKIIRMTFGIGMLNNEQFKSKRIQKEVKLSKPTVRAKKRKAFKKMKKNGGNLK